MTIHFHRQAPSHSKDFQDDLLETDLLGNIFQDVMMFVNVHVSPVYMSVLFGADNGAIQQIRKLLPDVYVELTVFVDHLPLNEHTPSYPFSVLLSMLVSLPMVTMIRLTRLSVSSSHLGEWEGGKLCLYEAGHVWRLKPWDIIIFCSGRITHFNLHFSGLRVSLILHSDNHGDSWASGMDDTAFEYNGWAHHVS